MFVKFTHQIICVIILFDYIILWVEISRMIRLKSHKYTFVFPDLRRDRITYDLLGNFFIIHKIETLKTKNIKHSNS